MASKSEYVNNYKKENYKRIAFEMRLEKYKAMKAVCDELNTPVNTFIRQAIDHYMLSMKQELEKLRDFDFTEAEE